MHSVSRTSTDKHPGGSLVFTSLGRQMKPGFVLETGALLETRVQKRSLLSKWQIYCLEFSPSEAPRAALEAFLKATRLCWLPCKGLSLHVWTSQYRRGFVFLFYITIFLKKLYFWNQAYFAVINHCFKAHRNYNLPNGCRIENWECWVLLISSPFVVGWNFIIESPSYNMPRAV